MRTILIIIDGASEDKISELGITPLEYAKTPTIDKITEDGFHKKADFCPPNRKPDSLNCILTMLGVDEKSLPVNRAYLEALAAGIKVADDEAVLRCNLIGMRNNYVESFNASGLSRGEMHNASNNIKLNNEIRFYHIGDYRNIVVAKKSSNIIKLEDVPPHENVGRRVDDILIHIKKIPILNEFVEENRFRTRGREFMFYPWGVSEPVKLPSFLSLHGKSCSCVCHAATVKGIAKAMAIDLPEIENSTGDTDTDLYEKSAAVLNEIKNHNVVIAHINGTDEASHRRDINGKIEFIERIDREFLSSIYKNIDEDTKIVIVSDHRTSTVSGKHERGSVDFICNKISKERQLEWLKL